MTETTVRILVDNVTPRVRKKLDALCADLVELGIQVHYRELSEMYWTEPSD